MTDYRIKLSPTVYRPARVLAIIRIKGHRQDYYATGRNPREAQRLAWCNFLTLGGEVGLRSLPPKPKQEQELKQYCLSCLRPMTQDDWDTHLVWASDSVGCFDDPGGEWVCPDDPEGGDDGCRDCNRRIE